MRILCVCDRGNVRSVTMARILKARGHDALACGIDRNSFATLLLLEGWAELILVSETKQKGDFASVSKIKNLHLGPDVWGKAMHPELVRKIKRELKLINL